jgi:hypothetical protein
MSLLPEVMSFTAVKTFIMWQKAKIRECTVEELYALPPSNPQTQAKVIPTTIPASQTAAASPASPRPSNPLGNTSSNAITEKSFLQTHVVSIVVVVAIAAIGVVVYCSYRKPTEEKKKQNK